MATARRLRERVPTFLQMEATECGAACLGMVMARYGRFQPLEELRITCGVARDGATARGIVQAARSYGMKTRAFTRDPDTLKDLRFPIVVHWRFAHFQSYDDAGNSANAADPDYDGIQNLMEFALGLNPKLPSTLPATLVINGNQMEYTYTRSKAALASVNFVVERTDSLSEGSWITSNVSEVSPPLSDNGVLQTVKVVLPKGGDRRFVRLRVMVQP